MMNTNYDWEMDSLGISFIFETVRGFSREIWVIFSTKVSMMRRWTVNGRWAQEIKRGLMFAKKNN